METEGATEDVVSEIMSDIENIEYSDYDDSDENGGVSDYFSNQASTKHPKVVVDYFNQYYPGKSVEAFLEKFLKPVFLGQGELDNNFMALVVGQWRYLEPIYSQEITAIYTFEPFEDTIENHYSEEEQSYGEEDNRKFNYDDLDYGAPYPQKIWQNQQMQLFDIFTTSYHGTNIERARQSFPQFSSLFNQIETWGKQQKSKIPPKEKE